MDWTKSREREVDDSPIGQLSLRYDQMSQQFATPTYLVLTSERALLTTRYQAQRCPSFSLSGIEKVKSTSSTATLIPGENGTLMMEKHSTPKLFTS